MAKRSRTKRKGRKKRMTEEEEQEKEFRRIQEQTFYNMGPMFFDNVSRNIEGGLRNEKGRDFVREDFLNGEGRGKTHKDLAAVIVAGGPSVKIFDHLETLKAHYKDRRFTIIAVDAMLAPLVRKGIFPDYVFSADPQPETAPFYEVATMKSYREKLKRAKTMAVFPGWIHPDVLINWTLERRAFYWGSSSFGKYMEVSEFFNSLVNLGTVNTHAHVTGAALTFAHEMGFKTVGTIGTDYCYDVDDSFQDGGWYKYLREQGVDEETIFKDLQPNKYIDPHTGEEVVSDVVWMSYVGYMLGWLMSLVPPETPLRPDFKVFNCSQRGMFQDTPQTDGEGKVIWPGNILVRNKGVTFKNFLEAVENWYESSEE